MIGRSSAWRVPWAYGHRGQDSTYKAESLANFPSSSLIKNSMRKLTFVLVLSWAVISSGTSAFRRGVFPEHQIIQIFIICGSGVGGGGMLLFYLL